MIEKQLYNILKDLCEGRVYPLAAPKNSITPYIIYSNISDIDLTSMQGENYANKIRFQVDVYSPSYSEVKEIKGSVKEKLYKDFGYIVQDFNSTDMYEDDTQLSRQLIEFRILK